MTVAAALGVLALAGAPAPAQRIDGEALPWRVRVSVPAPTRIRVIARAPGCTARLSVSLDGRRPTRRRVAGRRWRAVSVPLTAGEHEVVLRRGRCPVLVDRLDVSWTPAPLTTFQWQLSGPLDLSADAALYDVDLFDVSAADVGRLHALGRRVACYFSAGTLERGRPDSTAFRQSVVGAALPDWPDERWLDVRRLDVLGPILERRLDLCAAKGFDGVEADNVDAYANHSGFPLRAADQLRFNRFLARAAHARGLAIGLKNDLDQAAALEPSFDWALAEQCFEYRECARLRPFTDAGKAVVVVEYSLAREAFCPGAAAAGLSAMRKRVELDAALEPCW